MMQSLKILKLCYLERNEKSFISANLNIIKIVPFGQKNVLISDLLRDCQL